MRTNCKYRDKLFAYTRELAAVIFKWERSWHVLRKPGLPKRWVSLQMMLIGRFCKF
jgi:hypothetical protein